jgi:hypothetical protein
VAQSAAAAGYVIQFGYGSFRPRFRGCQSAEFRPLFVRSCRNGASPR